MKTTEEMIEIMQAYVDGKEIEYKDIFEKEWRPVVTPLWNWHKCDYRIKPAQEPDPKNYIPYDSVMEINRNKWIRLKNSGILRRIVQTNSTNNTIHMVGCKHCIPLVDLFYYFEYEDGTPCGKLKGVYR